MTEERESSISSAANISRRDFLKIAGAASVYWLAGGQPRQQIALPGTNSDVLATDVAAYQVNWAARGFITGENPTYTLQEYDTSMNGNTSDPESWKTTILNQPIRPDLRYLHFEDPANPIALAQRGDQTGFYRFLSLNKAVGSPPLPLPEGIHPEGFSFKEFVQLSPSNECIPVIPAEDTMLAFLTSSTPDGGNTVTLAREEADRISGAIFVAAGVNYRLIAAEALYTNPPDPQAARGTVYALTQNGEYVIRQTNLAVSHSGPLPPPNPGQRVLDLPNTTTEIARGRTDQLRYIATMTTYPDLRRNTSHSTPIPPPVWYPGCSSRETNLRTVVVEQPDANNPDRYHIKIREVGVGGEAMRLDKDFTLPGLMAFTLPEGDDGQVTLAAIIREDGIKFLPGEKLQPSIVMMDATSGQITARKPIEGLGGVRNFKVLTKYPGYDSYVLDRNNTLYNWMVKLPQ